jgi:uncharacterized protein with HEPN domain
MRGELGDDARLMHIWEAMNSIVTYTKGADFEMFSTNRMMFDACCRQLEIIGEASNHISGELRVLHSEIPWARMVAFRNFAIHQYFGVDERIVWDIIVNNLPELREWIGGILEKI